jgi:hypothetical protein
LTRVGEFVQNQEAIAARTKATLARFTSRSDREKAEYDANVAKRIDRRNAEHTLRTYEPPPVAAKLATDYTPARDGVTYEAGHEPAYQRTANP